MESVASNASDLNSVSVHLSGRRARQESEKNAVAAFGVEAIGAQCRSGPEGVARSEKPAYSATCFLRATLFFRAEVPFSGQGSVVKMTRSQGQFSASEKPLPESGAGDITGRLPEQPAVQSPSDFSSDSPSSVQPRIADVCVEPLAALAQTVPRTVPVWPSDRSSDARSAPPLTPFQRLSCVVCGVLLLAGFALAGWLQPSARGYGTHQQLGLPPCSIQLLFGIPCPSCGMTTSFALFVRGQIPAAFQANPAGLYLR